MKTFSLSLVLLILAMCLIPIGGLCESHPDHELYFRTFLLSEVFCLLSLIRFLILIIRNEKK